MPHRYSGNRFYPGLVWHMDFGQLSLFIRHACSKQHEIYNFASTDHFHAVDSEQAEEDRHSNFVHYDIEYYGTGASHIFQKSIYITVFSVFESSVMKLQQIVENHMHKSNCKMMRTSDLRGNRGFARSNLFLKSVAGFEFPEQLNKRIEQHRTVRNALVHATDIIDEKSEVAQAMICLARCVGLEDGVLIDLSPSSFDDVVFTTRNYWLPTEISILLFHDAMAYLQTADKNACDLFGVPRAQAGSRDERTLKADLPVKISEKNCVVLDRVFEEISNPVRTV